MKSTSISNKYILEFNELEVGDIILESGKKPHSLAIQKYTKSNYSHAMICVSKGSLVHAEKNGIFSLNPQRILVDKENDFKVLRLKESLSEFQRKKLETFLRHKIGSLYSVKDALMVAIDKNTKNTNQYQFCSRLVAQAYKHIGYDLVDNPDFCSPGDIERSELLVEVPGLIRKAYSAEIEFAQTRNMILENQKSFYKWVNKTRKLATKNGFEVVVVTDIDYFLKKFPYYDEQVCKWIKESGYLENYLIEVENNLHMHDVDMFFRKYGKEVESLVHALIGEYNNTIEPMQRHIENYINSKKNYEATKLMFYKIHIDLYSNILSVFLSKHTTLFNVATKLLKTRCIHQSQVKEVQQNTKYWIEELKTIGIEKFDTNSLKY